MRYQIELTHSKPTHTAVIRGRVPAKELARCVPAACGEVWSFFRSAGLPKPGRHMALYLDNQGSIEVGAEVTAPFTGTDRIHCSQLPAGRVATTVHFGPYQRLSDAHAAIRDWCAEHKHRCSGISWGNLRPLGRRLEPRPLKNPHGHFLFIALSFLNGAGPCHHSSCLVAQRLRNAFSSSGVLE